MRPQAQTTNVTNDAGGAPTSTIVGMGVPKSKPPSQLTTTKAVQATGKPLQAKLDLVNGDVRDWEEEDDQMEAAELQDGRPQQQHNLLQRQPKRHLLMQPYLPQEPSPTPVPHDECWRGWTGKAHQS